MDTTSNDDRHTFINAIDLTDLPPMKTPTNSIQAANDIQQLGDQARPSAYIDAGSLVSFAANMSPAHRDAVLNTTLLAQLAADKSYRRFDPGQVSNWYQEYLKVMQVCGWRIQDPQFQHYQSPHSQFSISSAVFDITRSFMTNTETSIVNSTINALSNLKDDDPSYIIWNQNTNHPVIFGNFQILSDNATPIL